ncbi:hypothetical protein ACSS31_00735 [Priestia megaterium]
MLNTFGKNVLRVLKKGGVLLSGFANPALYLFGEGEKALQVVNKLPYDGTKNTVENDEELIKNGGVQFSHSLETQIGGQLKAGFTLQDLYEDHHHKGKSLNICLVIWQLNPLNNSWLSC